MRLVLLLLAVALIGYFIMQQVNEFQALYPTSDPTAPTTQDKLDALQKNAADYQQKIQQY